MSWYDELATGAFNELLSDGRPGTKTVKLVYAIADAVTRFGPFPPPSGGSWDREQVEEVASDFFTHPGTPRRFATVTARATGGRSFAAQLEQAFRNYLRDEARETDRGHLIGRLRDVLSNDDRFSQTGRGGARAWHLVDGDATVTSISEDDLVGASFSVREVRLLRWSGRRGPVASREDLARLLEAVLKAADGAVPERTLVDVVARRFGLNLDGTAGSLDDIADERALADRDVQVEAEAEVRDEARRVWYQLTRRERLILAHMDLTDRKLAKVLGLGSSAANVARGRLGDALRTAIGGHSHGQEVYELLQALATQWVRRRTTERGYSSDNHASGNRPSPSGAEPDLRGPETDRPGDVDER